ncbi:MULTISPECIES: sugar ABC transporter ATP-binding protein [unclassified Arthrobacter]|uniref:sugar ABC transporter ATP-binding protein n=1 Tax=unclassified Arthrobacter TaxID=235627 RepID=UPI001E5FF359|nr:MULTISPECIES: sugar ABC transporter ATP-binding protein [unclassified Arthrobacter]MCC9145245.1 sugar ABC transporter ATP-binding protein [Arthrobacter sp. zg-Y919]MDK1276473.1 sugar ABC transporter ATP-binding protein [Arthrobacter sp. zg.Y919]WIB01928.1 sugar ABC transporter ATP-binding protein [Arthrobacter sp. zg-Y919]
MDQSSPVVEMHGITVAFPGVKALDGVDFRLFPGEVHALMGENGAGKSTLVKALTGVHRTDGGSVTVMGRPAVFASPAAAQEAGISTVYQEVNLCPNLTVEENILLGREPRRFGHIQWKQVRRKARAVLAQLQLGHLDPGSVLSTHSIAVQQLVAIARSVQVDAKVLVLDEPTSSLDADEVQQLFGVIRSLRDRGVAVLFVSHFLEQVYAISDRMTVLRNGKLVGEYRTAELPRMGLIQKMIGKDLEVLEELDRGDTRHTAGAPGSAPLLEAEHLGRKGSVENITVSIGPGQILGLAGLLGSGRTETARLLFGADRADQGELRIRGAARSLRNPRTAIEQGIGFSSENRKEEGLVGDLSVKDNMVLAMQARNGWLRRVPRHLQDQLAEEFIQTLDIRPANKEALVRNLSGGNQQKVLLARWLITNPALLILDEPTRGIDIGAKTQIQTYISSLADDGMSIVFISAELEEVLRLSDHLAVLKDREMVADLPNQGVSMEDVMTIIAGTGE